MKYIPAQGTGFMRAGPDKRCCAFRLGLGNAEGCGEAGRCKA